MIKILVAPDSFKESLSASQAAQAIQAGILQAAKYHSVKAQVHCIPMADGGEGTLECLAHSTQCELLPCSTVNALGQAITAQWAWLPEQATAFIEMASAAGLQQIPPTERNILQATTYGVGLLIKDALNHPLKRLVLCLGGSATNDAGLGMLEALGIQFLDEQGQSIHAIKPSDIARIRSINKQLLDPRLQELEIILAADVQNPLYGPQGAAYIFAPQKGASPEQVKRLDQDLMSLADLVQNCLGHDYSQLAGAGAAGGLGFAALSFFQAQMISGISLLAEYSQLAQHIAQADVVITGEGSIDAQTLQGKTLAGIAQLCRAHNKPLIALAGRLQEGYQQLYEQGLTAAFSLNPGGISHEQSLEQSARLLQALSQDVMALYISATQHLDTGQLGNKKDN